MILDDVKAWLETLPELAGWRYSLGAWSDDAGPVIAIWRDGGRLDVDERIANVRLVLAGQRNTRTGAAALLLAAEAIYTGCRSACIGEAVRVLPRGDIVGPGYTDDGRPWAEVNLELLI